MPKYKKRRFWSLYGTSFTFGKRLENLTYVNIISQLILSIMLEQWQ